MKKIFILMSMILIGALPACTVLARVPVNPDYTTIFQGQSKYDIMRQAGVPDKEASDGRDGVIYEYSNWSRLKSRTDFLNLIRSSDNISYIQSIAFFFDKEDRCYLVKTDAQYFQRQHSSGRTTGLILGLGGGLVGFGLFVLMMVALISAMSVS